ncbi:MAG: AIR synthase-related protein, partial [Pseudomonadota bacterium]|nr:AIR synthase-related protein [Pseudomonadota bacterium]
VTVQALGEVRSGAALTRAGACPGDDVYVSGCLGDAAFGLAALQDGERGDDAELLRRRLDYPEPRCTLGRGLVGLASAAIDISDGLLADLGHLLRAGGVGARVERDRIPLSPAVASRTGGEGTWRAVLAGGDDYELCFTAPSSARGRIAELARDLGEPVTRIGMIEAEPGLRLCDAAGLRLPLPGEGYDHFNG